VAGGPEQPEAGISGYMTPGSTVADLAATVTNVACEAFPPPPSAAGTMEAQSRSRVSPRIRSIEGR
jgi:hypothetical protein